MTRIARRLHHSYEDYLNALEVSQIKLEYCDGEIYAMAGGTPTHADLAASMIRILGNALLGRCRVSSSDLKIRIESTDLSTFPDVSVVCGQRAVSSIDKNAVINPTLLVEVLSPSTEDYDRGEKLNHYKECDSLQAVLLVAYQRREVTVITRSAGGWTTRCVEGGQELHLAQPELRISLDELYDGIL
ncbi:MAG: Uma2 family endonuclease [Kofleriaceae bacterium]|nr:Uma2 family endonuclease [Kofleriaceae bacterium]